MEQDTKFHGSLFYGIYLRLWVEEAGNQTGNVSMHRQEKSPTKLVFTV